MTADLRHSIWCESVCVSSASPVYLHIPEKSFLCLRPSVYIFGSEILFLVCQPGARRALLLLVNSCRRPTMDGMYIIALRLAAGISWQIYIRGAGPSSSSSFCFAHTWKDLRRWSDRQQSPVFHLSLYSALCGDTQLVWFRCAVVFFTRTFPLLCTHIYNRGGGLDERLIVVASISCVWERKPREAGATPRSDSIAIPTSGHSPVQLVCCSAIPSHFLLQLPFSKQIPKSRI